VRRWRTILGISAIFAAPLVFGQTPAQLPEQFRGIRPNSSSSIQLPTVIPPRQPDPQPPPVVQPRLIDLQPAPVLAPPEPTPPAKKLIVATPTAAPSVTVEKRCPDTITAGQPLAYDILIRNVGQSPVFYVRVEDELPTGSRYIASEPTAEIIGERMVWNVGQLDANAERKIHIELQPSVEGELRGTAIVSFTAAASMRTQVVRPKLMVALSGPEQSLVGDLVTMQIQVANPGTGPANNVLLRVKLPMGLNHPGGSYIEADVGTLVPGECKTIPLRVTGTAGGTQVAEITATGDGALECFAKSQVMVQQPRLQLRRTGPAKVMFRGEVNEEYELTNPGNAPAGNVTVSEILPVGFEFVGASDGAIFDPAVRAVMWKIGQVAPGSTRTVTLKSKATTVGDFATRASAVADRGVEAKADGSLTVEGVPALRLEVADLEDPIEVGGELTYEIRVFNQGSCPCTGIRITCDVPDGLTAFEANGAAAGRIQGNKVTFEPLAKLATKADAVFRVKVRGDQPGDYRFKVQMNCKQFRLPVNKEESSRVYQN
jgi:uncharacterized repeat protein (TIGR01451 family)